MCTISINDAQLICLSNLSLTRNYKLNLINSCFYKKFYKGFRKGADVMLCLLYSIILTSKAGFNLCFNLVLGLY